MEIISEKDNFNVCAPQKMKTQFCTLICGYININFFVFLFSVLLYIVLQMILFYALILLTYIVLYIIDDKIFIYFVDSNTFNLTEIQINRILISIQLVIFL